MQQNNSFFSPQRQSKIGIILLFLYNAAQLVKNFWFAVIFLWTKREKLDFLSIGASVAVFLLLLLMYSILHYRNFTYQIDADAQEFVIREGTFNKSVLHIKTQNVQEVTISQPFIHRLLNIYKLEIDSPGSSEKEIVVRALSHKNATDLKAYLTANAGTKETKEETNEVFHQRIHDKISFKNLLRYSVTSNYLQSFVGFVSIVGYVISELDDLLKNTRFEDHLEYSHILDSAITSSLLLIFFLVISVLILGILFNTLKNIIGFYDFKITENERSFSLEHGLLSTKNFLISKQKVQVVSETQNRLQKLMNISALKLLQIGSKDYDKKSARIPGIDDALKAKVLQSIWHEMPEFTEILRPNYRWIIAKNIQFVILPFCIAILVFWLFSFYYIFPIIIFAAIVELMILASYYNLRLSISDHFIQKKAGVWDVDTHTFKIEQLQTVKISQYFWQKKSNLGRITFYTAAGSYSFPAVDFTKVKQLLNLAVYKIEIAEE